MRIIFYKHTLFFEEDDLRRFYPYTKSIFPLINSIKLNIMKTSNLFLKTNALLGFLFFIVVSAFSFKSSFTDPIAILDHPEIIQGQKEMTAEEFKESEGVSLLLKGDYEIARFYLVKVSKGKDPLEAVSRQGSYSRTAKMMVSTATSGDTFYFEKILVTCPDFQSEEEWLKLNSIVIHIK